MPNANPIKPKCPHCNRRRERYNATCTRSECQQAEYESKRVPAKPAAIALRVPSELADALTEHAESIGTSRNQLIVDVLEAWIGGDYADAERKRIANQVADEVRAAVIAAMGGN